MKKVNVSGMFNAISRVTYVTWVLHVNAAILRELTCFMLRPIHRGSNMSDHVLLNLLNELRKREKCETCRVFYFFFATGLINSIIQHEC